MPETLRRVLWIDDDSPKEGHVVGGFEFRTAQTCAAALAILLDNAFMPDAIIVDIVLPQGGWGDRFYETPGIELVKQVRDQRPGIDLAVFSIAINEERTRRAHEAGADLVRSKNQLGLLQLLKELRQAKDTTTRKDAD